MKIDVFYSLPLYRITACDNFPRACYVRNFHFILDEVYAKYLKKNPKLRPHFTVNNTNIMNLQNEANILFLVVVV